MAKTLKELIEYLHKKINVKTSGTGTTYVYFDGKKIRISNHEPNDSLLFLRGKLDLEIYTHNVEGRQINDKYDVVELVAEYLDLPIKGYLKGIITRHFNKSMKELKEVTKIRMQEEKERLQLIKESDLFYKRIKDTLKGEEKAVKKILQEAENYSESAPNGNIRRKKRMKYFKRELNKKYGIVATVAEVRKATKFNI